MDQQLIAGLRTCGINPADATQVNEQVDEYQSDYLVFRGVKPYPAVKMRCLARRLIQAEYGVRKSGEQFASAYATQWDKEFTINKQEFATVWLEQHHAGKALPVFVPETQSIESFARNIEEFCGATLKSLQVDGRVLSVPLVEHEPHADCLYATALATKLEMHGFSVQPPAVD